MRLPITLVFINLSQTKILFSDKFQESTDHIKDDSEKKQLKCKDLISCLENTKPKSTKHEAPLLNTEKAPRDAVNFHKSWSFMGFKDNVSSARNFNIRLSAGCVWDYLEAQ